MRTLIGGALVALTLALSACGGSNSSSASQEALQRESDLYEISLIERAFHEAISKKDIDKLVGLFSAHATGTFRPGQTVSGKNEIRKVWLDSTAWKPDDALGVRPSRVQAQGHHRRGPGHAPLRVPFRRRRHG